MSLSDDRPESTVDDLLTDEERDDLERVIQSAARRHVGTAPSEDVRRRLEDVYLEGRLSGLCREGALELVTDTLPSLRVVPVSHDARPNGCRPIGPND